MSLSWPDSARIVLIAPVSSVGEAAAVAAAGAGMVDVADPALIPQIRDLLGDVRICGRGEDADIVRDAGLAARTGAGLICPDPDAAARAVRGGVPAERILVRTTPARLEAVAGAGWATLADLDEGTYPLARAAAVAAVCAWLGVRVIRTRHIAEIRRAVDMTESILGRRPPAWTVRGLA